MRMTVSNPPGGHFPYYVANVPCKLSGRSAEDGFCCVSLADTRASVRTVLSSSFQLSARFRTTLHFNGEYLWNGSSNRQAENGVINQDTFHVRQKMGKLWSTNKRVYGANVYPPKINTSRAVYRLMQLHSAGGVFRSNISTHKLSPQSDLQRRAAAR